ncbi:hypothetical protein AX17_005137 [Amanita inopinata Kibby_2008]|nr:hypothetical protein AX17_005137 [Amanita inopinata Kibby_2008]
MLGNSMRGLPPSMKSLLYRAIALPIMTYGAVLWFQPGLCSANKHLGKLQVTQNLALRFITGAFCTTPIGPMEYLSGIPPIKLTIHHLVSLALACIHTLWDNHFTKVQLQSPHIIQSRRRSQRYTVQRAFSDAKLDIGSPTPDHPSLVWGNCTRDMPNLTINTSHPKRGTLFFDAWLTDLKTTLREATTVYSNGSVKNSAGSAGYVCPLTQHSHKFACRGSSSFCAEIHGLEEAIHYIAQYLSGHITLVCDSKSAIQSILALHKHQYHEASIRANISV